MLPDYYEQFKRAFFQRMDELKLTLEGQPNAVYFLREVLSLVAWLETWGPDEEHPLVSGLKSICESMATGHGNGEEAFADLEKLSAQLEQLKDTFDSCFRPEECRLSIVMIGKNEGRYLREWLEYHLLVGAEHFYIFDNESTDDTKQILEPYVREGLVTYSYYPGPHRLTQIACYNETLLRHRYDTRYMALIDADEFLVPMEGESIPDLVEDIVRGTEAHPYRYRRQEHLVGGIGVNWRVYGTSHHETAPEGLVIDNYRYRAPDDLDINAHIKTICNPRAVDSISNFHFMNYRPGYECVSDRGSTIPNAFFYDASGSRLRLNHYYCKSEEEFRRKRILGERKANTQTLESIAHANEQEDDSMDRFVDRIRAAVEARKKEAEYKI